jgi:serine/threonine protein kinase
MESYSKSTNIQINKVKNRFLPLSEPVAKGLEPEAKFTDFSVNKLLGEGSFGKVHLVTHKKTGAVYAIKSIDKKNKNNQEGKPYFRREIEIMYKVHHPNIVRLFSHFEDDDYCYFVMEYISKGNLFDILSKQKTKCFEVKTVAYFIRDLISAVYFLHNMDPPIVHRDIKPENVLLQNDGKLKLTDFGWSNYIDENESRNTYCGTPVYLAPEMIREIGHDEHLDIWCIGVLMFELLTGTIPFPGNTINTLSENILRTKINWPKDINFDAKNLIGKILKPDPKDRISLVDMLKHPFFTKNISNPTEFLFTPKEIEQIMDLKPYLLSKDLPCGFMLNKDKEGTNSGNQLGSNNNNITNVISNNLKENKLKKIELLKDKENQTSDLSKENSNKNINQNNLPTLKEFNQMQQPLSDLTPNIKELYDKLKLDYETLTSSYNELVRTKSEVSKKIEDYSYKEGYFKQEKESLLKELEDKDNERLNLQKMVADLNHRLLEKDNKMSNMTNLLSLVRDKCKKDEEEIDKLHIYIDKISLQKDEEVKEYKQKISELQKKLIKDDTLENQISSLRQSISGIGDKFSSTPQNEEFSEYRKRMEAELRETKEYLTQEMENLKKEMQREREKYSYVLKNKEDEIKKLNDEKNIIKENEAKKYEKVILRYETYLKEKEIEIENLKGKIRKLENIIAVNNLRKNN